MSHFHISIPISDTLIVSEADLEVLILFVSQLDDDLDDPDDLNDFDNLDWLDNLDYRDDRDDQDDWDDLDEQDDIDDLDYLNDLDDQDQMTIRFADDWPYGILLYDSAQRGFTVW